MLKRGQENNEKGALPDVGATLVVAREMTTLVVVAYIAVDRIRFSNAGQAQGLPLVCCAKAVVGVK